MPRKPKPQEPITPQELSALNDKTTQDPAVRKYHVATDAKNLAGLKKRRRVLRIILGAVTAVLLILFIISMLVSKWGDLVIEIDRPLQSRGIVLSTDPEFKTKSVALSAKQALNVTNITYSWLPTDLDTSKDGEHNGKNYVAYTFYCKNEGEAEVDYKATLDISGVAKSADEACRVMVYKNGEPTVYAKGKYDNRDEAEKDTVKFLDDKTVMSTTTENFKPDNVDKYTVVVWIEGADPECVDEIGGMFNFPRYYKIIMDFTGELGGLAWVITIVAIVLLIAVMGLIVWLIIVAIKKFIKSRQRRKDTDSLVREVQSLNNPKMFYGSDEGWMSPSTPMNVETDNSTYWTYTYSVPSNYCTNPKFQRRVNGDTKNTWSPSNRGYLTRYKVTGDGTGEWLS